MVSNWNELLLQYYKLRAQEGLSHEEAAAELKVPPKGKWRIHDLKSSRNDRNERMVKARAQNAIPVLAENQILHLMDIASRGLPDCYKSFEDFLTDFWPDFSWNADSGAIEVKSVLADPRFKFIVPILWDTWGVDMVAVLQAGLNFSVADLFYQ